MTTTALFTLDKDNPNTRILRQEYHDADGKRVAVGAPNFGGRICRRPGAAMSFLAHWGELTDFEEGA